MDFRTILGTSNKRRLLLLELLYHRRGGWPSDQLLSDLNCSLPILLNDIDLINSFKPNLQIIKVKGLYRIVVDNSLSLGNLYADFLKNCPEFQIIEELLYEECENITALSKKLYLSSSNTQRYLKKIEQALSSAGIELCYRPLRVEGNEGEIRNFYYRFYSERQSAFESTLSKLPSSHYHILERYVRDFVDVNRIHQKYIFEKRLLYNMYISFWRIKHNHPFPEEQLQSTEKITLPQGLSYKLLKQAVMKGVELELTPEMLRDTLWLTYSDSIIFSLLHRELALTENPKYKRLFMQHFSLAEEFNEMLGSRLTNLNCLDLATVLNNDFYLCNPNGKYLAVLWRNRSVFIEEVSKVYKLGVKKVRDLVERFVSKYHIYQEDDFVQNYIYLLITTEVYSLEWLASQEPLIKILLLSDLTPTEESFLAKQIYENVYGNFEIFHFEQLSGGTPNLWGELKSYDCLVTTGSSEGLPDDYSVVVIDPFLTSQSAKWIQNMVSDLSEQREASLVK
ncbi:MAG: helix-turn-helix domain-containing protein [Enterococcus sp.]